MEKVGRIAAIIAQAIERQGGNKSEIARRIGISSQLLGQYEKGPKEPKMGFFARWRREFNEDLFREIETKVYDLPEEVKPEIEISLTSLLEGQNEIRAQLQTIHQWDAEVYAAGDEAKWAEAREHIGMLYADNLAAYRKRGIRPLVGRRDNVIP